jgi:hypothetical protein
MVEVVFDITIDETGAHETPLLDTYERDMMLHHTKVQIENHVQQSLGDLYCEEHGGQAKVVVSGTYSMDTEQLDLSYHIDACCKLLLLKAIAALNRNPH